MRKTTGQLPEHLPELVKDAQNLLEEKAANHLLDLQQARNIARVLLSWNMPDTVVCAVFLIPLLRRGRVNDYELQERFGERPPALARSVIKLLYQDQTMEVARQITPKMRQTEKLRRFFHEAYNDIESALTCAAIRIANLPYVKEMSDIERSSWAQENMTIYLPLFELLGLWQYRREIGDQSLMVAHPGFFTALQKSIHSHYQRHRALFRRIELVLKDAFEDENIVNASIRLHNNTAVSLNQRIIQAQRSGAKPKPDDVNILSVDVILETQSDCYRVLGLIHNRWKPLIRHSAHKDGRFHDYIATPRYNGYRCLITTIEAEDVPPPENIRDNKRRKRPQRKLVEFRIRTREMEQVNLYGITYAIHARHQIKNVWWTDTRAREFMRKRNTEQLRAQNEIAVFTPTGQVMYPFEKGSTVIDAAFRIHSSLGPYARTFYVNGKTVPYLYELHNGDLVEIEFDLTFPSLEPKWEEYAKAKTVREHIQRFMKEQNRSAPHNGRQIIDKVLQREMDVYQLRLPEPKVDQWLNKLARQYDCPTVDLLYFLVLESRVSADDLVASIIEEELRGYIVTENGERPTKKIQFSRSWMQEVSKHKFDPSLRVMPGVNIVGHIRPSQPDILVVHNASSRYTPQEGVIPLQWRTTNTQREFADIVIHAPPRKRALNMVINLIEAIGKDEEQKRVYIETINAQVQEGHEKIELSIDTPSMREVHQIREALEALQRGQYISNFRIWQMFPGQKMLLASKYDKRHHNPYTLKQVRDQSMFYGREDEIRRIIDLIQNGGNNFIVLYGQQRIGKTTLLYHLAEYHIPQACNVLPILLDLHSVSPCTTENFLMALGDATMKKLSDRFHRANERRNLRLHPGDLERNPFQAFARWVKKVEAKLQGVSLLFIVDEFTMTEEAVKAGTIDLSFFNGIQHLVGTQDIGFLLCIHDYVYKDERSGGGMYQRGAPIHLRALDREAACRLIQNPLENHYTLAEGLVDAIIDMTDCHPYFIHAICHALVAHMADQPDTHHIEHELLDKVRRFVLNEGDHYFRHLRVYVGEYDWEVLRVIASETTGKPWVTSEEIRAKLAKYKLNADPLQVAKSIGDLRNLGLLRQNDSRHEHQIAIGIFAHWVRYVVTQVTFEPE